MSISITFPKNILAQNLYNTTVPAKAL